MTAATTRDAGFAATERLRQLIVEGAIAPGSELSQVELGRMLGLSTTPVREALRELEAEGLVQSRRNRRPIVPAFDPGDLDAVYCSRILLESLAISLSAAAMTDPELAAIRADLDSMRAAADGEDVLAWNEAHAGFHNRLVADCEPALSAQIRTMMSRADRYRRMSVAADPDAWLVSEREHEAIAAACGRRDPEQAASLLARHLSRSATALLANLAPEFEPTAFPAALAMVEAGGPGGR
jgi:DNA-binding GntR family transcriptional regulator